MSNLLWGKVFFKEHFAGLLKEETGGGYSFQYDEDYLQSNSPAISYSLVIKKQRIAQTNYFFDNLIAVLICEGSAFGSIARKLLL